MSTRHHVRALCDRLAPAPLAPLLAHSGSVPPSAALAELEDHLEQLRVGGGAVAMHARAQWDTPTTPLEGLPDHAALLLVGLSLYAAQRAATHPPAAPAQAAAALQALQAAEPDFFDELLLELSRRYRAQPETAALLQGHAAALRAATAPLCAGDARHHPEAHGLAAGVRRLLGRADGTAPAWRHLRLLTSLVLLEIKPSPADP